MNVHTVDSNGLIQPSAAAVSARQDFHPQPEQETGRREAMGREEVQKMVEAIQTQIDSMNVSLKFSTYGEKGERVAVIVADKETGEVIREIPTREIQDLYRKMSELSGVIFNRQA